MACDNNEVEISADQINPSNADNPNHLLNVHEHLGTFACLNFKIYIVETFINYIFSRSTEK